MLQPVPFLFGTHVPLPLNDADFIDITSSHSGHIGAGLDERLEGRGVLMKAFDAFRVEEEMTRRGVSEAVAKLALTPAYMVFAISCGHPALYLLTPDGGVRAEVTIMMHDIPTAEIWDYQVDSEVADASIGFASDLQAAHESS